MGRVIAMAFFVVGFFIFMAAKAAATGVKAAYKAVNEVEHQNVPAVPSQGSFREKMAGYVVLGLEYQALNMGDRSLSSVPNNAKDEWSRGYILGFSRRCTIDILPDINPFFVEMMVFSLIFGDEKSLAHRTDTFNAVTAHDGAARQGFCVGVYEGARWSAALKAEDKDDDYWPNGWISHAITVYR